MNQTYFSCPICGSDSIIKNGYNIRVVKHNTDAFWKKIYTIKISKYICTKCNHTFFENTKFIIYNCSFSLPTIYSILVSLSELNSTFTSVANHFHISKMECIKLFDRFIADPITSTLPEIISFDEKFINRNICENGYSFIIVDWLNVKIVNILSSRHLNKLGDYFSKISLKSRSNVKYITMDMYDTYLRIAKTYFNNAIIAVDSFHVLQNLIRAFDKVRIRIMKKHDNGADNLDDNTREYYLLKKGSDLLYKLNGELGTTRKHYRKLNMWISDRTLVRYITDISPELKQAYWLMQEYLEFNRCSTYDEAKIEIDELIDKFYNSKINSYMEFAKTISTWKEYILNSFIIIFDETRNKYRRLSDGPIEGLNAQIEKININSNGFKNFKLFRKIVIYKINKNILFRL